MELSKVLANPGNTQVARVAAGLQVKNSLTSKDPDVKTQYQQRWLAIDVNARREIKNYVRTNCIKCKRDCFPSVHTLRPHWTFSLPKTTVYCVCTGIHLQMCGHQYLKPVFLICILSHIHQDRTVWFHFFHQYKSRSLNQMYKQIDRINCSYGGFDDITSCIFIRNCLKSVNSLILLKLHHFSDTLVGPACFYTFVFMCSEDIYLNANTVRW